MRMTFPEATLYSAPRPVKSRAATSSGKLRPSPLIIAKHDKQERCPSIALEVETSKSHAAQRQARFRYREAS